MSDTLVDSLERILDQAKPNKAIHMPHEYLAGIVKHMKADARKIEDMESWLYFTKAIQPVDELIADLESKKLGWSLDHTGALIEARVWDWPNVIGRYRPHKIEPLAHMLQRAINAIPDVPG